jgi:thiamine transport system substrate-binding protein
MSFSVLTIPFSAARWKTTSFIAYDSPALTRESDELKLDPSNRALPVDYGDVCLNYDVLWFDGRGLEPPSNLADLIDPAYANLTVVQNPATSTPGLAFLLATIETFGEDGYLDYWRSLVDNGVVVTDGWEQAYYTYFTAASDGDRPIVVSYASSPAAEVYFAEQPPQAPPTAAVLTPGSCFRQIEFAGILRGTPNEAEARRLVDFLLSVEFQEDIPLRMFVYPANRQAQLPEVFVLHSDAAEAPVQMDPARIAANRETWIQAWTEVVLR